MGEKVMENTIVKVTNKILELEVSLFEKQVMLINLVAKATDKDLARKEIASCELAEQVLSKGTISKICTIAKGIVHLDYNKDKCEVICKKQVCVTLNELYYAVQGKSKNASKSTKDKLVEKVKALGYSEIEALEYVIKHAPKK